MKINLEDIIYICKYHNLDKEYYKTLGIKKKQLNVILADLKKRGLYEQYNQLDEYEYDEIRKQEIRNKNANAYIVKEELKKEPEYVQETKEEYMPDNKLMDLNDYLFEELQRLNNRDLTQDQLNMEIKISKQIVSVSQTIINNASLLFQAKKHFDSQKVENNEVAPLLRLGDSNGKNIQ